MGAIITRDSKDKIKSAVDAMEKRGAKIRVDGRNPSAPSEYPNGNWLGATVIDGLKAEDESVVTEIFGPVLTIIRVATLAEAIAIENKHPYGNATSIFTTSGAAARYVSDRASNGMIGINIGVPVPREPFSFGGRKQSKFGAGDITGYSSLDFWSDQKKITMKWSEESDKNWMS
jgi:malonate-semialdehyde dehydrogenase (acetylating) / methylmalonate-semialdehyde dehydrogenase